MTDLRSAARALGGEVSGRGVLCPGPGHSARDRSLSVAFSPSAPDGFTLFSHAGDDFAACRDHVRATLGLAGRGRADLPGRAATARPVRESKDCDRAAAALRIWGDAEHPSGTPVEAYLGSRGLSLPEDAYEVIRYHPSCPFAGSRTGAMVALVRDIMTDAPVAIHRTALELAGRKVAIAGKDRLALGPVSGGAVKLTADEAVTSCLGIGEGIESVLSLRQLPEFGTSPVWALLNTAGVTAFSPLPGIECLWIAVDHDPAGERAADTCAARWRAAGREVFRVKARAPGADLNDLQEVRRAG